MTTPAHIIVICSGKGGVGKTMLARLLLCYLEQRPEKLECRAFDGQKPDGILKRFHPDCTTVVDVRKSDDQVEIFKGLQPGQVRLIDLAAGELDFLATIGELGFIDDVRAGRLAITVFHVIGSTQASFDEIAGVKKLVAGARHFLVTNHINDAAFIGLSAELKSLANGVIDIPQLNASAAEHVDRAGVSFSLFEADEALYPLVMRRYVTAWRTRCFAAIHAAGAHH